MVMLGSHSILLNSDIGIGHTRYIKLHTIEKHIILHISTEHCNYHYQKRTHLKMVLNLSFIAWCLGCFRIEISKCPKQYQQIKLNIVTLHEFFLPCIKRKVILCSYIYIIQMILTMTFSIGILLLKAVKLCASVHIFHIYVCLLSVI